MLSHTAVKQLKARLKAEKTPLLYSVVYSHSDMEDHNDTIWVGDDPDSGTRFAKLWANKKEVFFGDWPTVWLLTWKKGKEVSRVQLLVKWKKEH